MRGHKPRKSKDPREDRSYLLRMPGSLHNRLIDTSKHLKVSINRLVTLLIREGLDKMDPPPPPDTPSS